MSSIDSSKSCIRHTRNFRVHESGNTMKGILGCSNLQWDPEVPSRKVSITPPREESQSSLIRAAFRVIEASPIRKRESSPYVDICPITSPPKTHRVVDDVLQSSFDNQKNRNVSRKYQDRYVKKKYNEEIFAEDNIPRSTRPW